MEGCNQRNAEAVASDTSTTKHTDLPPKIVLHQGTGTTGCTVQNEQVAVLVSTGRLNMVRWVNSRIDRLDIGFG